MEQKRTAPRAQKTQPLTYREWKRRKQLRLARNWGLFLAGCALVVFLLTKGILWLLPHLHGADGPQTFAASAYDSTDYFFDADDARLVLVNANLPFDEEPSPTLDAADEAGTQLEAEAAQQLFSSCCVVCLLLLLQAVRQKAKHNDKDKYLNIDLNN